MVVSHFGASAILRSLEARGPVRGGSRADSWYVCCPCSQNHHNNDARQSGSVWIEEGRVRCWCARGCRFEDWVSALGTPKEWWMSPARSHSQARVVPMIVATYDYRDEDGELAYQVVKTNPKGFYQRRRPPGSDLWAYGLRRGWYELRDGSYRQCATGLGEGPGRRFLEERQPLLYRLPELLAANPKAPVVIVEGEKDVDNLRSLGFTAICNSGGAGKWDLSFGRHLAGRPVLVIGDNDPAGREHACLVAGNCLMAGCLGIRIHQWEPDELPEKGDFSDWLNIARSNAATVDDLRRSVIRRFFASVGRTYKVAGA